LEDFYVPVLKESVIYNRIVGYFSSTSLVLYAKGMSGMIANGGKANFIISPFISKEDAEAIKMGYEMREQVIERVILSNWEDNLGSLADERLNYIAWLIASGQIDIKVAIPKTKSGMLHEKIGMMVDCDGNRIAFTGSSNETYSGLTGNIESIDVYSDLNGDQMRIDEYELEIDSIINGINDTVDVYELPVAIRNKILKYKQDYYSVNDPQTLCLDVNVMSLNVKLISLNATCITLYIECGNEFMGDRRNKLQLRATFGTKIDDTGVEVTCETETIQEFIVKMVDFFEVKRGFRIIWPEQLRSLVRTFENNESDFNNFTKDAYKARNADFESEEYNAFKSTIADLLSRRLTKFQMRSAFHAIKAMNACNFSVPGAGKTSIAYAVFAYFNSLPANDSRYVDKLMVIGPISSFEPWDSEFEACFGPKRRKSLTILTSGVNRQAKRDYLKSLLVYDVTILNYDMVNALATEIISFLKNHRTMLVLDEAHRIKNINAYRSEAVLRFAPFSKAKLVLTGTPLPNGYEDLFNFFEFLWPKRNIIGCTRVQLMNATANSNEQVINRVREKVNPFFVRVTKDLLGITPPNPNNIVNTPLTSEEHKLYRCLIDEPLNTSTDFDIRRRFAKARIIRLMQATTNPRMLLRPISECIGGAYAFDDYGDDLISIDEGDIIVNPVRNSKSKILDLVHKIGTSSKFVVLKGLVENLLSEDKKVIIWSVFVQNIFDIKSMFENISETEILYGGNKNEREEIISRFKNDSQLRIVVANPAAVSESISLHMACHDAVYFDLSFNATHFIQSKDRIHRLGLPEGTQTNYHFIQSSGTVDEVIYSRLLEKERRMNSMIENELPPLFVHEFEDDWTAVERHIVEQTL
jgi:hypothetical protein